MGVAPEGGPTGPAFACTVHVSPSAVQEPAGHTQTLSLQTAFRLDPQESYRQVPLVIVLHDESPGAGAGVPPPNPKPNCARRLPHEEDDVAAAPVTLLSAKALKAFFKLS